MQNPIKEQLAAGQPSIGSWLNLTSPLAAEVMAAAGFKWLVVDAEHSAFDLGHIAHTFRAIDVPEAAIREDFTDPQNRFYGACSQRSGKVNSYGFGEVGTSVVEQTVSEGEGRVREKSSAV